MAFEIKKQERENNQALVRRFTKRIKESGILKTARTAMFRKRVKSENVRRQSALRRIEKKKEYEKLAKLGKIDLAIRRS